MNAITIELCAEDRARLDKLAAALEKATARPPIFCFDMEKGSNTTQPETPEETAEPAPEATEAATPPATQPAEETPAEAPSAPAEANEPAVTLAQIQQKVIQLAAGFGGSKKAAVREIVNAYAKKVSDLPEDKLPEIWAKLTALEKEG
jgi:hypothetical protein